MADDKKTIDQQQEIMRVLEFNYRDLDANREGRITYQQGKEIWKRESHHWQKPLRMAFILGLGTIGLALLGLSNLFGRESSLFTLWVAGLNLFLVLIYFSAALIKMLPLYIDISQREVRQMHGIVIHNYIDGYHPRDAFTINSQQFRAKEPVLKSIEHLEPYVVHYLPRSKAIVSVEVMVG